MKTCLSFLIALFFSLNAFGQYLVSFETLTLPGANTYWRGQNAVPLDSFFLAGNTGNVKFPNSWDTAWGGSWSGWGFSNKVDTTSISYFSNELASIAGGAYSDTAGIYAVAYQSWNPAMNSIKLPWQMLPGSCYITNTTIAYRSMQNGDGFAKKFGGATGNDPDYFKIRFYGWLNGNSSFGTPVDFYLADFRDTNNANDYIVKQWKNCDLMPLGVVDSITYTLFSSDTSAFGINTPTYFCIDQMAFIIGGLAELPQNVMNVYPIPMQDVLMLDNKQTEPMQITLCDMQGRVMMRREVALGLQSISVAALTPGAYVLQVQTGDKRFSRSLIKQ